MVYHRGLIGLSWKTLFRLLDLMYENIREDFENVHDLKVLDEEIKRIKCQIKNLVVKNAG